MSSISHPSVAERSAGGRAARQSVTRSSQSVLDLPAGRDPIALLEAQDATRVPELVPIRYGRMVGSPLTFLRGAAAVMAHDLAVLPHSGLHAQLCGDAHLLNFGGFATPERNLVFDVNDFDETAPGPFEWDVKRLAASLEVAGRVRGFSAEDRKAAVLESVRSYREAMLGFAQMGDLDVWYARLDVDAAFEELHAEHDQKLARQLQHEISKARAKDGRAALATLTHSVDGKPRIVSEPPLLVPLAELADPSAAEVLVREGYRSYRLSLQPDRRLLLEQFRLGDAARKVVGIGSVGTQCFVLLLFGRDDSDPLFLQLKEAEMSVLGSSAGSNQGERVVQGQRLMQAASDIFLGWVRLKEAMDGGRRDFYMRQLRDWKVSLDVESILPHGLSRYASACGWTLARAHARSGDRIAIAAYLGAGDKFDRAIEEFAVAYADLTERDHASLVQAVADGRIAALEGV
jgi:uncharacterized protein (DUF2252 family)